LAFISGHEVQTEVSSPLLEQVVGHVAGQAMHFDPSLLVVKPDLQAHTELKTMLVSLQVWQD
jgi:hypothetical protein